MSDELEFRIKSVMSAVFKVPLEDFNEMTSPQTIKTWDSLKHMNMILALEDEFNIEFTDEDISSMVSYPIIVASVEAYKV